MMSSSITGPVCSVCCEGGRGIVIMLHNLSQVQFVFPQLYVHVQCSWPAFVIRRGNVKGESGEEGGTVLWVYMCSQLVG